MSPSHIVDIGANRGDWTRKARKVFPDAKLTMFEPQTSLAQSHLDLAADPDIKIEYVGLGDIDGTATFTLHTRDDSSSFNYSTEQAEAQGFTQVDIPVCKLDTYIAQSGRPQPGIVKIDAEGLDLSVLRGATETLLNVDVVLIEAAVANPIYPNTVLTVMGEMDRRGFKLLDITDLNRTPQNKLLWLVELAFIRKDSTFVTKTSVYR